MSRSFALLANGQQIETEEHIDVNGKDVHRQTVELGSSGGGGTALVTNAAPGAADLGLVTRPLLYDASGHALVAKNVPPDGTEYGLIVRDAGLRPNRVANGTFNGNGQTLEVSAEGAGNIYYEVDSGLTATIQIEATLDGTNWRSVAGTTGGWNPTSSGTTVTSFNLTGNSQAGQIIGSGLFKVRLRVSAFTSGSVGVRIAVSDNTLGVRVLQLPPLATGSNQIGKLAANAGINIGSVSVDNGTIDQISNPVAVLDGGLPLQTWPPGSSGSYWALEHSPAAANQATVTKASPGAVRLICTNITISLSSGAAPTVGVVKFVLRDGASGAGTIIWSCKMSLPATAGIAESLSIPVFIMGSVSTAMTIETVGAPPANVEATVAFSGGFF